MQKLSIPHFYGKTRAILAGRLAGMAGKALGWPVRTGRICVLDSSALERQHGVIEKLIAILGFGSYKTFMKCIFNTQPIRNIIKVKQLSAF